MRQKICSICLLVLSLALVGVVASALEVQELTTPPQQGGYAGEERREIKSLSTEEIEQLLQGHSMELAKAAELNHYPGPRHVLDLGGQLELTPAQRAETEAAFRRMQDEAVQLGRQIVERERALDASFAKGEIDAGKLRASTSEIARLQGTLRAAHLTAHLEMRRILSPAQIKKYDELRGYTNAKQTPASPHDHRSHGKH